MHARVSTYQTDDPESLASGFASVPQELEQVEGFSHGYFLVARTTGKGGRSRSGRAKKRCRRAA